MSAAFTKYYKLRVSFNQKYANYMKVYVQVVDTLSGISQNGMIDESTFKGLELQNALAHFGINAGYVNWHTEKILDASVMVGNIDGTSKIVSAILLNNA